MGRVSLAVGNATPSGTIGADATTASSRHLSAHAAWRERALSAEPRARDRVEPRCVVHHRRGPFATASILVSSPSALVGAGWGGVPRGTDVPHLPTPNPNPSPQGGGEK